MSTFDNQPPIDGWQVQPGRHCGELCVDLACPVCGEWVTGPDVVLGEN